MKIRHFEREIMDICEQRPRCRTLVSSNLPRQRNDPAWVEREIAVGKSYNNALEALQSTPSSKSKASWASCSKKAWFRSNSGHQ